MVEIDCPDDCRYLVASRAHPPAVIQRQQDRDAAFLLPVFEALSSDQQKLLLLVQAILRRGHADTPGVTDDDFARAARALADTYETASRGIIYEHAAGVALVERMRPDVDTLIETARSKGLRVSDAEVADVLRRIEQAARDARKVLPGNGAAYVGLLKRTFSSDTQEELLPDAGAPEAGGSGLIVPGR